MELQDLNRREKLVSIALFHFLVTADGVGSSGEAVHAAKLAAAYGEEDYQALLEESSSIHETEEDFKELVAEVETQEVRELIFGAVMECAIEDGLEHRESRFLDWLASEWVIDIKYLDDKA